MDAGGDVPFTSGHHNEASTVWKNGFVLTFYSHEVIS